jgi:protein involved in polysaccharide export with SLBB domain
MRRCLLFALLCTFAGAPLAAQGTSPGADGSDAATLHSGDAVRIAIWREPDLSGEFTVDPSGRIILPMLGEMNVAEMTADRLRDTLLVQYSRHLRNPSITITPLRRINVLGEVSRPGLYAMDPTITLAGAVGIAGGATPTGNLSRITVMRAGQGQPTRVSSIATLDHVQLRSGDQIIVERRSWFDRNSTFMVSMVISVTSIVISLVR